METKKNSDSVNSLHISEEVVATVAKLATSEIEGVSALALLPVALFPPAPPKTVEVKVADNVAVIHVGINIKYGYKVTDVALRIQNSVKSSVQSMTGITVDKVNVSVAGIDFGENG